MYLSSLGCALHILVHAPHTYLLNMNGDNDMVKLISLSSQVAQSVTCLTADPWVTSSIPAQSYTFVEIDHEIMSTVILLPPTDSFKIGCCQLQAKVCAQVLVTVQGSNFSSHTRKMRVK